MTDEIRTDSSGISDLWNEAASAALTEAGITDPAFDLGRLANYDPDQDLYSGLTDEEIETNARLTVENYLSEHGYVVESYDGEWKLLYGTFGTLDAARDALGGGNIERIVPAGKFGPDEVCEIWIGGTRYQPEQAPSLISVTDASIRLSITEGRVRQLARGMGCRQVSGVWVITETDIRAMEARNSKRGPRKTIYTISRIDTGEIVDTVNSEHRALVIADALDRLNTPEGSKRNHAVTSDDPADMDEYGDFVPSVEIEVQDVYDYLVDGCGLSEDEAQRLVD